MATSKKSATKKTTRPAKTVGAKKQKQFVISVDLSALDKLYRNRYVISLDGGDTKGGSVRIRDGDTKGGILIRDGDTKGGGRPTLPGRGDPGPLRGAAKKVSRKG